MFEQLMQYDNIGLLFFACNIATLLGGGSTIWIQ